MWRGPVLLDVAEVEFFQPVRTRLEELRLAAIEDRVKADLQLGRGAELVTELTTLVAEHPLREQLIGALMRALNEAGRPAEALTVYERTRQILADELGAVRRRSCPPYRGAARSDRHQTGTARRDSRAAGEPANPADQLRRP